MAVHAQEMCIFCPFIASSHITSRDGNSDYSGWGLLSASAVMCLLALLR